MNSKFQLIHYWENLETIQNELKQKQGIILKQKKDYYTYSLDSSIMKKYSIIETEYVPMIPVLDNNGEISQLWVNYEATFFNMNIDTISNLKSLILVSTTNKTHNFRIENFFMNASFSCWRCFNSADVYDIKDEQTITLSKSLYIVRTFIFKSSDRFTTDFQLPAFYSKFLIEFYNPEIKTF
jgi:hypothetical protein